MRGNVIDIIKTALPNFAGTKTDRGGVEHIGVAVGGMSSASGWMFGSEQFLRRLIPLLVLVLLVFVAGARTVFLMSEATQIEKTARIELSYISEIAATRMNAADSLQRSLISPSVASVFLEDALPRQAVVPGRSIFLLNEAGKVVASNPLAETLQGVQLSRLTQNDKLIATLGEKAGIREIELDGSTPALALFRSLGQPGQPAFGGLLVVQSSQEMFASWRQSVRLNIVLFMTMSTVLLVILYAYFAQGTRAREADQLFMETNARYDTALARGHCGLWDWDLARGGIVWSRSMYEILGMQPTGRVMGFGDLNALMHPDDQDLMQLANQAFESPQQQIDHRFRMMHACGSWVWMRIRAELVRYKGADPHLIGIAVDITEQETLKQRSRDADIRLRDAIENISEAFVLWDSKKRMVMCNTKYQQFYDLPSKMALNGASHDDVMERASKPRIKTTVSSDRNLEAGSQTMEAQLEDGRWLQISERRTQDGGFVSVGTDITQIKRHEEKLVDSERRLKATVSDLRNTQQELEMQAQRLVELAEKYNDEKNRAEAGSRAKSEFLANISHELRTPLNAIIGFSDIMQSEMFGPLGSEKYDEYATDIHHSGNFLLGVINDILDMSKIEAGRFQLNPEPVHLHDLLDETLRIIKMQASDASITVSQKIPENLELQADRRAVKQILLNILSNAVKFTPEDGRINVTAKQLKSSISIVIEDNGIGISKSALKRLGQPFEQVQDQFTKDHKGSGLGLAIARSLTGLHGGTLKIRSEPGKGTMVAIRLPNECTAVAPQDDDVEFEAA